MNLKSKAQKTTADQTGFTIVELIVAMIVGAIFASSLSLIVVNQSQISQSGRDTTLANSYAETKIESIRSAGFLSLSNGTTDVTSELPSELSEPRSGTLVVDTYDTGVKSIALTIEYNDRGETQTFNYETLVGELGVGQY